jgi:phage tail sheath protein FI
MSASDGPDGSVPGSPSGVPAIAGAPTSIAAFLGRSSQGPTDQSVLVASWSDFERQFGGLHHSDGLPDYLGYAVYQFFANGGQQAYIARLAADGSGLERLDNAAFNLLCAPGETDVALLQSLQQHCKDKRAFLIIDCPPTATTSMLRQLGPAGTNSGVLVGKGALSGPSAANAAYYYPWVQAPDPLIGNQPGYFPPSGFVAGIYATTDAARGVWTAPAGIKAGLSGALGLQYNLTDPEDAALNAQGINCLRMLAGQGTAVWGARTLQGEGATDSNFKYVPIRRFALFLEASILAGTQWTTFVPNGAPLWAQLRTSVGAFMQGLFQQGAFQGTTPQQAYLVTCDAANNPQSSIDQGIVNITVGFAPLRPAEFVVIQIRQLAGPSS